MEIKINLFDLTACGFYSRGYQLEHEFGTLNETLLDLQRWAANRKLRSTKTFTPKDGSDLLPVYLFDIKSAEDGSWLVVTWNETQSFDGSVASADGDSPVGAANVELNEIQEGGIPGFPTYFYIIPDAQIIASVRPYHDSTGLPGLREYMKSYLEFFSKYVHLEEENNNGVTVLYPVGYSKSEEYYFEADELSIKFETKETRNPGRLQYIRDNVEKVSKIIRKMTLDLNHKVKLRFFQKALQGIGIHRDQQTTDQKIKIKYEIQEKITLDELNDMIEEWENTQDRTYDDYGLVLRGSDQQPFWFSSSKANGRFDLNVIEINDAKIDSTSLLTALTHHKDQILQLKA